MTLSQTSKLILTTGIFSVALSVGSYAASIGVNFVGGGRNTVAANLTLAPTDTAGVVPQGNYNNVVGGSGTGINLLDQSGLASGASLTYTSQGVYAVIDSGTPAGGDEKLNTGFIYGNATISLSNIPYALYDVYVYSLNDASQRIEELTINGVTFYGKSLNPSATGVVDQNAATPFTYIQTTATSTGAAIESNYVRVQGLTGSSLSFSGVATGNGFINGFQVVQVPEPTAGLLGLAGLAAAGLRRRRTVSA